MDVVLNQAWPYHIIPNQTNSKSFQNLQKQDSSCWNYHRTFRWILSQIKPNKTIRNLTKPNQLRCCLKPYQTKPTKASDWCFLKPNQTISNQLKIFSKTVKSCQILMKLLKKLQMGNQINSLSLSLSLSCLIVETSFCISYI